MTHMFVIAVVFPFGSELIDVSTPVCHYHCNSAKFRSIIVVYFVLPNQRTVRTLI